MMILLYVPIISGFRHFVIFLCPIAAKTPGSAKSRSGATKALGGLAFYLQSMYNTICIYLYAIILRGNHCGNPKNGRYMLMDYIFMTDSDSDLPFHLQQELDIPYVSMPYTLNGKEYFDDLGQTLDFKSYYDMMRAGATPTTSALNEAAYTEIFEPLLAAGNDILFIAFSSRMSATRTFFSLSGRRLYNKTSAITSPYENLCVFYIA